MDFAGINLSVKKTDRSKEKIPKDEEKIIGISIQEHTSQSMILDGKIFKIEFDLDKMLTQINEGRNISKLVLDESNLFIGSSDLKDSFLITNKSIITNEQLSQLSGYSKEIRGKIQKLLLNAMFQFLYKKFEAVFGEKNTKALLINSNSNDIVMFPIFKYLIHKDNNYYLYEFYFDRVSWIFSSFSVNKIDDSFYSHLLTHGFDDISAEKVRESITIFGIDLKSEVELTQRDEFLQLADLELNSVSNALSKKQLKVFFKRNENHKSVYSHSSKVEDEVADTVVTIKKVGLKLKLKKINNNRYKILEVTNEESFFGKINDVCGQKNFSIQLGDHIEDIYKKLAAMPKGLQCATPKVKDGSGSREIKILFLKKHNIKLYFTSNEVTAIGFFGLGSDHDE